VEVPDVGTGDEGNEQVVEAVDTFEVGECGDDSHLVGVRKFIFGDEGGEHVVESGGALDLGEDDFSRGPSQCTGAFGIHVLKLSSRVP